MHQAIDSARQHLDLFLAPLLQSAGSLSLPAIAKSLPLQHALLQTYLQKVTCISSPRAEYDPASTDCAIDFAADLADQQQLRRLRFSLPSSADVFEEQTCKETLLYLFFNEHLALQNLPTSPEFSLEIRNPQESQEPFLASQDSLKLLLTSSPAEDTVTYTLLILLSPGFQPENTCQTENLTQPRKPQYQKYDRFLFEKPKVNNINLQVVDQLISKMDYDQDTHISQSDIQRFCQEHYLDIGADILTEMFRDAAKQRPQLNRDPESIFQAPLDRLEIIQALRIRSKRSAQGWQEVEKPFRKYWALFFEILGLPVDQESKDRKPMIHPLADIQSSSKEAKWQTQRTKPSGMSQTLPLKMPKIAKSCRPEASLEFSSGKHVRKVANEEVIYQGRQEPVQETSKLFMKVVNNRFESGVTFDTQEYYKESLALAAEPRLYRQSNPITKFVPAQRYKQSRQNLPEPALDEICAPRVSQIFSVHLNRSSNSQDQKNTYNRASNLHQRISAERESQKEKNALFQARYNLSPSPAPPALFHASFTPEQVIAVKKKLATSQCATMKPYSDPAQPQFREESHQPDSRSPFKVQVHPGKREVFVHLPEELHPQPQPNASTRPTWNSFYQKADLHQNFINHKYPQFLSKGDYQEPIQTLNNLLRDPVLIEDPFKLFHRPLKCEDRSKFFGENYSKLSPKE